MEQLQLTTLTIFDISSPTRIATYMADTYHELAVTVYMTSLEGGGMYRGCLTKELAATGGLFQGETVGINLAANAQFGFLPETRVFVQTGDIVEVWVQGLAVDTSAAVAVEIIDTQSTAPNVGAIGTEIWTGTYTRQINSVSSTISANVVQMNGDTDSVDNLVLALGNSSGVMISNAAVDAVWDEAIAGHLTAGTTGAKLNTASSAGGSGSTAYTNTVTDDSSNPLDGVEVWITSDSGGASTVASTTTNTLGAFTVYLDPGTYYLWLAKGGYNFPNPTTITVS